MSQRIVIMTTDSMPNYIWINITNKTAEELADELFTEAMPKPFDIERVIENKWDDYTIENYLKDKIEQLGYEEYYPVRQTTDSAIIELGDDWWRGKEVALELLH